MEDQIAFRNLSPFETVGRYEATDGLLESGGRR